MTDVPVLEGYGCRMRPVTVDDAAFIVNLRNQPFAKGNIHAASTSVDDQIRWIERWKLRERDYYWIIESIGNGEPLGTLGLYDVLEDFSEGMPGRLVMDSHGTINIIAPFLLLYRFAFETLKMKRLVMDVVATNKKVWRFHLAYGAQKIVVPDRYRGTEAEVGVPLVWLGFENSQWPKMHAEWSPVANSY